MEQLPEEVTCRPMMGEFILYYRGKIIGGIYDDRLFVDWYWVGHTKAWEIPGTEDLKPYIPKKVMFGKWAATIVVNPLIAAILAGIVTWLF